MPESAPEPGEADKMLGADVGCEDRRADQEPAGAAAREEVVGGVPLFISAHHTQMAVLATKYRATIVQSSDEKVTAVPVIQCGLLVFVAGAARPAPIV